MSDELTEISLNYGQDACFRTELLRKRILLQHTAPTGVPDVAAAVRAALQTPIDFPGITQAVTADDRVAVVMDVDTPQAAEVFAVLWEQLQAAGVAAERVTLLQPAVWKAASGADPRSRLAEEPREAIRLHRHDPTVEESCGYLASTASGERVYLARGLIEADVIVTVGPARFDPVLGVRGTSSSLYPGLSDVDAIRKAQGQGHDELGPDETRPLRQMVDEIGWLAGLQLSIALLPAEGGKVQRVLAGQSDSVLRQAREVLRSSWFIHSEERAELVLVAVPEDAAGHGWEQVAAAIEVGRRLVERNGRIVVLSQLAEPPGPGLEILKETRSPRDALKPIRRAQVPDLLAAARIATAVDWANVLLLSRLDPGLVDDLFLIPLESEDEVRRLLERDELTAIVESAQHAFVLPTV